MVIDNMAQQKQDKQGYLGNLEAKSDVELKDLLIRQQKLLINEKFIHSLPDKGEKITQLISRIEKVLSRQDDVDMTSELLDKLQIDAERKRDKRSGLQENETNDSDIETSLDLMINKVGGEKVVHDERVSGQDTQAHLMVNSYQKIIRKENSPATKMSKFKLNSALKVREVKELPDEYKGPATVNQMQDSSHLTPSPAQRDIVILEPNNSETVNKLISLMETDNHGNVNKNSVKEDKKPRKFVYDEALEADPKSTRRHHSVKMLSLEESFTLQQQQQAAQKELLAKQATEKLTARFASLSKVYHPEGSDMRYRENVEVESDGSEDEMDYPD